jgi:hypothetical protein
VPVHRALPRSAVVVPVCLLVLVLVALGLILHARSAAQHRQAATIDPRLVLAPHTITQSKQIAGLHVALTAAPLLPGINHFTVRIDTNGHPSSQAAVAVTATMLGMVMRPLHFACTAEGGDRYAATGALPMFGRWQIAPRIRQPHGGMVAATFPLSLNLPAGLVSSSRTRQR